MKCISITWLSEADLSNLNSGEGSGNLTELKTYDRGRKPYTSGQSNRRALFDTIAREYPDSFKCTAELPCVDVENCWGCDLRGFLATEEGVGGDRRWSPLKVSPGMGQIPSEIVTDLLTRSSDITKEGRSSSDQRIAHVQMAENIYKLSVVIDVDNIGKVKVPQVEGKGNKQSFAGWETRVNISSQERINRIKAVLDGVFNLSGFAKQARTATSLSPDVVIITLQPAYNQRSVKALELNNNGEVDLGRLKVFLDEHRALGNEVIFGHTPGVVSNDSELLQMLEKQEIKADPVYEAFNKAKSSVEKAIGE